MSNEKNNTQNIYDFDLLKVYCQQKFKECPCLIFHEGLMVDEGGHPLGPFGEEWVSEYFRTILQTVLAIPAKGTLPDGWCFLPVSENAMRKCISLVHDHNKWGPDLYGWDGKSELIWSRD